MKLAKYTLNLDGTIPDWVEDGGYFPTESGKESPQDLILVGIVADKVEAEEVTDLEAYLLSIGADTWVDFEENPIDVALLAQNFIESRLQ